MAADSVSLTSQLWLPFVATAGASLTVLAIQSLNQFRKEHRQRIYAVGYMADVLYRGVQSELIIQKHTVDPHIEAIKRMLSGDRALIELTLDTDEFDILSAGPMSFVQLPENYKLLVGYDDIHIIQAFDALLYLHSNDTTRLALRSFVAENLKSKKKFLELGIEHQQDILNTYWDYLRGLEHEGKRLAAFAFYIFSPMLRAYAGSWKFKLFATKPIFQTLDRIASLQEEYKELVPSQEFFKQSRDGGIQGAL
jgi:hypothetical protein